MTRGAVFALWLLVGCEVDRTDTPVVAPRARLAETARASSAPSNSAPPVAPPCTAPSLLANSPLDARDEAALSDCQRPSTGPGRLARACGQEESVTAIAHAALREAVRPFDDATLRHVKTLAATGRSAGRRDRVFGLVGDSMTVSGAFLRNPPRPLDAEVADSLRSESGHSIVDFYAGAEALRVRGVWTDSFGAPRAAKVGARAAWALAGGEHAPLEVMVRQLSPAVAVVLFGGNDAAFTAHLPLADLTDRFARDLEAIVDALEARGVIPVLNTLARHGSAPGFDDCGTELTNWRITVQTNALSARVVEIACRRHLPLIDVRAALDTAVNLGLGPDQIHPSGYEKGPEILDERGLRCGYNVRNYVTLLMLKQIRELVFDEVQPGNRSTKP